MDTNFTAWLSAEAADRLVPYYQPILALDSRTIVGYEALGRYVTDEGVRSVGPFFADKTIPMEEQVRVDRMLREKAIADSSSRAEGAMLFLNIKPSWMYKTYVETGALPTLALLEKYGINPKRVVIEITEESFREPMEHLRTVVDIYREAGCLIAIDDVGSGYSDMDRIAQIEPHILKIDIHMLQRSKSHRGYYALLHSFSALASQIGASLLVEGVETQQDFERAIQVGARYVQGFLFARAEADFLPAGSFTSLIEQGLCQRRDRKIAEERRWNAEAEQLRLLIEQALEVGSLYLETIKEQGGCAGLDVGAADRFVEMLLPELSKQCLRVYLCSDEGIQRSSNYEQRVTGRWNREEQYRMLNWSWRPFFVPLALQLGDGSVQSTVSRAYTDLGGFDRIRTISVSVPGGGVLFADFHEGYV
ncbi:EAL domain-containing protein (putative c-di-GMP-specific phosphodiesterase class I) [Paenibacillus phyllosphaerae]|uniref:EAL domain-containing protein (Putative c-di-GMP-specific phosphodiesterase class I) n=1 Tax=Paenibacillus phyllosphaerae TaxID=274593 RepID=A0A7W5B3K9_9BACL|nr:EAL domain-containing protein [Paenibacillus phyllosphaerae]MBB3113793.1 EAL domain-containing protein (putative c-di-GMP-specific phosphodiesterase class I) [Paenibacillus phyllosphaerae]